MFLVTLLLEYKNLHVVMPARKPGGLELDGRGVVVMNAEANSLSGCVLKLASEDIPAVCFNQYCTGQKESHPSTSERSRCICSFNKNLLNTSTVMALGQTLRAQDESYPCVSFRERWGA